MQIVNYCNCEENKRYHGESNYQIIKRHKYNIDNNNKVGTS